MRAGDTPRVDANLAVGETTQTVIVEATTPLLQSENSTLQSSVNQLAVQDLPLNGRNFVQLVQLVVGANEGPPGSLTNGTKPDDKRQSASFSANGQSEVLNNQMIDGMDNNESLIGSVGIRPSVDAVSEIRVQTSVYSADTGRTGGAAVNIITKSGTNHIHGTAYEYFRNDVFNSYPFQFGKPACSATVKYPACNPKQELRQNQFGASIGGPIFKGKTFYFGDYEGFRLVSGVNPSVSTVPTAFEEQNFGNLSDQPNPANQFPITTNFGTTNSGFAPTAAAAGLTVDPVAADYMKFYPAPTSTAGGTCTTPGVASTCSLLTGQFVGIAINTQFSHVFDIRIDHQIDANNQLFGRYSYNNVKTWNPGVFGASTVAGVTLNPTGGGYSPSNDHSVALSYSHTFNQNLIGQLQVGYLRVVDSTYPAFFGNGNTVGPAADTAFGMPGVNISGFTSGLAHVGMASGGYTALGGGAFTPLTDQTQAYQGLATVTYTRGAHNFKFGGGLIRRHLTSVQSAAGLPQYTMSGALWGFETGIYSTDSRLLATTNPHYRRWEPSVYAQDDWHVTSNTTFNLGVRYDVFTPLTEINNNISTWNPVTEVIMVAGTPGVSPSANVRTYYGNVAPRIGFATTIKQGLVLRGGFAFSYYPDQITSNATPKNPPLLASFGPFPSSSAPAGYQYLRNGNPALGTALFQNINPANPVGAIRAATDPNFRPGMVEQFNVSIQKDFRGNVLTVAYVGNLERHTPQSFTDLNAPSPADPRVYVPGSNAWNALRPYYSKYPGLNTIGWYASEGSGSYHAAQVSFERRLTHGLSFNTNYTYSRNLDNAVGMSNQNTTAYGYWVPVSHSYDYGNSDLDLRNRFVVSVNYTLPFAQKATGFAGQAFKGWQVNTITGWNAGQPVTPVNSTSISGTESTNGGDRPSRVANPTISNKTISHFFNTAAYQQQPYGTLGASERNTLYGPHYRHVDLSLIKQFPIRESTHLEFRAEGFNITNTANFSTPNVIPQTTSTYGTITAMSPSYSPRVIQFALKLVY